MDNTLYLIAAVVISVAVVLGFRVFATWYARRRYHL